MPIIKAGGPLQGRCCCLVYYFGLCEADIFMVLFRYNLDSAACIHPKNWISWLENSAENSNFPQKDCLRTRKLSILQCVKKRSTGIFEDQSELKSLAEQVLGFRS